MPTLSSILVQRGAASMRAVEEAIARQVLHGGDLPTNLLELGAVSEQVLTAVLGESFGLLPAPAGRLQAPPPAVLGLISGELAVRHGIFPLDLRDRVLVLATAEPLSNVVEDDLGFALDVTIQQLAAPLARVRQAIAEHYGIALDRRLLRLVAKLDGRADPSPSSLPPPGREFTLGKPPRPISVPVPSFGTGLPSSRSSSDSGEEISTIAFAPLPKIPPSARVPREVEVGSTPTAPTEPSVGLAAASMSVLVRSAASELRPPSSRGPTTMPLPFDESRRGPVAMPVFATPIEPPKASRPATPPPPPLPEEALASEGPPTTEASAQAETTLTSTGAVASAAARAAAAEPSAKVDPRKARALAGWVRHERRSSGAAASAEPGAAWRAPRRKGPFTAEMAEKELSAATATDAVLEIFFTFALQFFEFAALFVVHGDIAEGRAVSGAGAARAKIAGIGVPLDLPSSLARARERKAPIIGPLSADGLDADLARDLDRGRRTPPAAVALVPVVVKGRAVAILYGDDGEADVTLSAIGDVIAFTGLVATALERIALRRKLGARAGEGAQGALSPAPSSVFPAPVRPPAKRAASVPRASGIAALAKAITQEGGDPAPPETQGEPMQNTLAEPAVEAPTSEEEPTTHERPPRGAEAALPGAPETARADALSGQGPWSSQGQPSSALGQTRASEEAPATVREQVEEVGQEAVASASEEAPTLDVVAPSAAARVASARLETTAEIEFAEPSIRGEDARAPASEAPSSPRPPDTEQISSSKPSSEPSSLGAALPSYPPSSPRPAIADAPARPRPAAGAPPSFPADEDAEPVTPRDPQGPGSASERRTAMRGKAPSYEGRSRTPPSTRDAIPRTSPPNATAWESFPSPKPPPLPVRLPLSDRPPIPREEDEPPSSSPPLSDDASVTPPLPSVIVDVSAEYASLIARVIEGGPGSHEAFNDLVRSGEQVLQALMARFPGPLRVDRHRARAELPAASQCGPILELIVAIRRPSLPFMSVRSSSPDVEIRFWATHVLGELRYPEAANVLVPRLFDDDASVRRIARRSAAALVSAGVAGAPILQGLDNITRNPDQPAPHRILAIETMGEIRIGAMVPPLIAVLGDASEDVSDAARRALLMITRQDFGRDPKRWQEWWIRNASRHRIEWLMDALMHEQPSLRRAAGDELKLLTKEYFGYYDDLPKKERERAQALYREWWEREGRSRFS